MCMAFCVPGPCPIFLNLNIRFADWLQFFKNLNWDLPTCLSPHTSDIFFAVSLGQLCIPSAPKSQRGFPGKPTGSGSHDKLWRAKWSPLLRDHRLAALAWMYIICTQLFYACFRRWALECPTHLLISEEGCTLNVAVLPVHLFFFNLFLVKTNSSSSKSFNGPFGCIWFVNSL